MDGQKLKTHFIAQAVVGGLHKSVESGSVYVPHTVVILSISSNSILCVDSQTVLAGCPTPTHSTPTPNVITDSSMSYSLVQYVKTVFYMGKPSHLKNINVRHVM